MYDMDYYVLTPPRSGGNYLAELIRQHLGMEIEKDYVFPKYKKIITVVRDPYWCIVSGSAMAAHYNPSMFAHDAINSHIVGNIKINRILITNSDIVIKYEDLIKDPIKVIKKIAIILNKEFIDIEYIDKIKTKEDLSHLKSSTISKHYNFFIEEVKKHNLSKNYEEYNKLLAQAISIS